ncbi:MAG: response regulator [Fibrobacterota bacterium]
MKTLIVEDEFSSRKILLKILSAYGPCDVAVTGKEAVEAFTAAHGDGQPYDLICLDIFMPEMDGQQTLQLIRAFEKSKGIGGLEGVKIIMTTGCEDKGAILSAFREGCEVYLIKPVQQAKLVLEMKNLGLI